MIILPIEEEVIVQAANYVDSRKLGKRGKFDGNRTEQIVGMTGEFMVAKILGMNIPTIEDGFDGGWDLNIGGKRIDVKTMGRTTSPKPEFVNNILKMQYHYKATHFVFCSLNKKNRELTICGLISKEELPNKATFHKQGEVRTRTNGTKFELQADTYEIANRDLVQVNSIAELKELLIFG